MFSYVFILFSYYFIVTYGQNSCQTPDNIPGFCIPIKSCSFIVDILQKEKPVTNTTKTKLKQYQCGTENQTPKVCCPHKNINLFNQTICAQHNSDRLIQGVEAILYDYPWNVLIAYNTDSGKEFLCEGSIINENYILTTAYCIKDLTQRFTLSHVRVGEHNLSSPIDCEDIGIPNDTYCGTPFQDIQISELIYHPNYNSSSNENNIGLIRLNRKLQFTDTLAPICLPFNFENEDESKFDNIMLIGWGTNNFAPQSPVLLKDRYQIRSIDDCARIYARIAPQIKINNTNDMCVDEKDLKRSGFYRCIGDSGNSAYLARFRQNGVVLVQYGIFTLGSKNCLNSNTPKVLIKVEPYLYWILESVKP